MEDHRKTKAELIDELIHARHQIAEIAHKDTTSPGERIMGEHERMAVERPVGDGMAIAKDGALLYVNERFLEIFGYESADEVMGRPISITVHPDNREGVRDSAWRAQHGENGTSPYEFLGARKDGTRVHVESYAMHTSFGGEAVSLVYLREITGRKRAIETLEKRLRVEEFVSAISTRFIDIGSHEIDELVQDALRAIGQFTGADDVCLMLFPLNGTLPKRGTTGIETTANRARGKNRICCPFHGPKKGSPEQT